MPAWTARWFIGYLPGMFLGLFAIACQDPDPASADADHDGVADREDCADHDAAVHPGAADAWYDGVDADCAGNDDFDADEDGARLEVDCDDADPTRAPGLEETWYDGIDADCAGDSDWDADGDAFTVPGAPDGDPTDCDDADPGLSPGIELNTDLSPTGVPSQPVASPGALWVGSAMLRVSNLTFVAQHHATVAAGEDGRFAVTWQWGRTYDRPYPLVRIVEDDAILGLPVSASPLGIGGIKPDIESQPGSYVVVFEETQTDLWLARFDLDGNPVGEPVKLTASAGLVEAPDLALFTDGTGVVAYTAVGGAAGEGTHRVQRFGVDLSPVGEPVDLQAGGRTVVDVVARPDGGWVAVATRQLVLQDRFEIYGRLVRGDGCVVNFRADQGESQAPSRPTLAIGPDGGFVATWRAKVAIAEGEGVYGRFFDDIGRARSDSFQLSGTDLDANRPVVSIWDDLAMFAWEGESDGGPLPAPLDVRTQTWSISQRLPVTAVQRLNEPGSTVSAERPAIGIAPRGDGTATAMVTWEQVGADTRVSTVPVTLVAP